MKSEKWSGARTSTLRKPEKEGFLVDGLEGGEKEESKLTPQYHQVSPASHRNKGKVEKQGPALL